MLENKNANKLSSIKKKKLKNKKRKLELKEVKETKKSKTNNNTTPIVIDDEDDDVIDLNITPNTPLASSSIPSTTISEATCNSSAEPTPPPTEHIINEEEKPKKKKATLEKQTKEVKKTTLEKQTEEVKSPTNSSPLSIDPKTIPLSISEIAKLAKNMVENEIKQSEGKPIHTKFSYPETEQKQEETELLLPSDVRHGTSTKNDTDFNTITMFRNVSSDWSLYYHIDYLAEQAAQQQQLAKPILTTDLKDMLAQRRRKLQETKKQQITPSSTSLEIPSTPTVVQKEDSVQLVSNESKKEVIEVDEDTSSTSEVQESEENEKVIDFEAVDEEEAPEGEDDAAVDLSVQPEETTEESAIENSVFGALAAPTNEFESNSEFISFGNLNDDADMDVPWVENKKELKSITNWSLQLHEEIIEFYNYVKQTKEEKQMRSHILNYYTSLISQIDPSAQVQCFGSYAMKLVLPGSDIDLSVKSIRYARDPIKFLRELKILLSKLKCTKELLLISQTRVPILKITDKETGQQFDVSCNSSDGQEAVEFILRARKQYPAFKYLVFVLKYLLKQRNLNEVHQGGLGSYALSLMVIHHLQLHISNFDAKLASQSSLGSLLIDFLALYGIYFNYFKVAIDVKNGGTYQQNMLREKYSDPYFAFHVRDPTDSSNNVTRSSSNMIGVRNAFRTAYGSLLSRSHHAPSLLSRIIVISKDLIGRKAAKEALHSRFDSIEISLLKKYEKSEKQRKNQERSMRQEELFLQRTYSDPFF